MIVSEKTGSNIPLLDEGVYQAICTQLIDLGYQYNEKYKNTSHKIMLRWEIIGETIEIQGETVPRMIHREYTSSLGDKSNLRKDLQAWRGRAFTPEELKGFDMKNILGKGCQLQIIHNQGTNGNTYANIACIMALPKGMSLPQPKELIFLDLDNAATFGAFDKLPEFVRNEIKQSQDYELSGLKNFVENGGGTANQFGELEDGSESDLPF